MKHISDENNFAASLPVAEVTKVRTVCGLWVDYGDALSLFPWVLDTQQRQIDVDCQPCLFGNAIKDELGSVTRSIEALTEEIRYLVHRSDASNQAVVAGEKRGWFR